MQHRHRFKAYFTATVIGTLPASICSQAWADDAGKAKPLALRKIMQDLGKNMQGVTDGIFHEDWEMVGRIAPLIADHPQPPLVEKMRILSFVGADTGKSRIQKRSATFTEFERQAGVASVLLKRPSKRNTDETLQAAHH